LLSEYKEKENNLNTQDGTGKLMEEKTKATIGRPKNQDKDNTNISNTQINDNKTTSERMSESERHSEARNDKLSNDKGYQRTTSVHAGAGT
jgi:hypothetical protein